MPDIKVRMTKTTPGSPDGISVSSYKEGEEYPIPEHLAKVFVDVLKVAVLVGRRREPAEPVEEKMVAGAPENKAALEVEPEVYVPAETPTKPPVRGAAARKG